MQHATLRKTIGFGFLALLVCLPLRAQQQNSQQSSTGDPVADAARKAKEQKKDAPKPKRVYTEDDLVTKKTDISVVGSAPTDSSTGQIDSTAAKTASKKGGEKEELTPEKIWRKRFADLRKKIDTAEQELSVLQREENKAEVQYYPDPTKAMKEQYSRDDINKKADKIAAKQKEIAALKQQWDDMEDQLRKSGGDPGWAR